VRRALPVTRFALRALYDGLFALAGVGMVWFAVAVLFPYSVLWLTTRMLPPAGAAVAALVAFVPGLPVSGGLYYVAVQIAREKRFVFAHFWEGIKEHYLLSLKVGGTILVSGIILLVDAFFYLNAGTLSLTVIGFLGLWGLLFWAAAQIYLFPMAFLLEKPRLLLVLRNAGALVFAYPFFALGILLVMALVTALSVLLLLILVATVWMPFIAILSSRATLSSIEEVRSFRAWSAEIREEQNGAGTDHRVGTEHRADT
jgi:hypothetical protein